MDIATYLSIRSTIQTGDLLGCQGTGPISWLIRWRSRSRFSHLGMFLRFSELSEDLVLLLHSAFPGGVTLGPASRYLQAVRGMAWWIPLDHVMAKSKNPAYREMLLSTVREAWRDYDVPGVIQYLVPWVSQVRGAYYCSELIAHAMVEAKLIDAFPSDEIHSQLTMQPIFNDPVAL